MDFDTFDKNPMEFYGVCTNVDTGRPLYHKFTNGKGKDMQYFTATASMPLVSQIVEIDGYKLLDGGVADSIPIKFWEHKGYNKNVVVLTQPLGYIKKPNKMLPIIELKYKDYPAFVKAIRTRHIRYNRTIDYIRQKELSGEIFVIRPPKALEIGGMEHNPDELRRVYEIGTNTMEENLKALRQFMHL